MTGVFAQAQRNEVAFLSRLVLFLRPALQIGSQRSVINQVMLIISSSITRSVPLLHSLHCHSDFISDLTLTNSSFTELYNKVMTFNESNVTATCCKVDGSPVSVTCGQGFSCAASCFSLEASLCPSHNCGACHRLEEEGVRGRKNSGATEASGGLSHCTRNQCKVGGRFKECCFHPICRKRRPKKCAWLQYLVGK